MMMKINCTTLLQTGVLACVLTTSQSEAAIALDRTRVVFDGQQRSVSMTIGNESQQQPYLAQGWLEDEQGNKIQQPLAVIPPVQRVEPGAKSQVKIQSLPQAASLPQDRETLYYFNLREIPPRSTKPNTLQLALQTRIKLFYRPHTLVPARNDVPFQEQLTLTRVGDRYRVNNPTGYYVTLSEGRQTVNGDAIGAFVPLMVAPKSEATLDVSAAALGSHPVLTYINDYGARPKLQFNCGRDSHCIATRVVPKT